MPQHHQTVSPVRARQDELEAAILDKGGPMEHIGPFVLLGLFILWAIWLSKRLRGRSGNGRAARMGRSANY